MRLGWLYYYTMLYLFQPLKYHEGTGWDVGNVGPGCVHAETNHGLKLLTVAYSLLIPLIWGLEVKMREALRDSQPQDPIRTASACWDCSLRIPFLHISSLKVLFGYIYAHVHCHALSSIESIVFFLWFSHHGPFWRTVCRDEGCCEANVSASMSHLSHRYRSAVTNGTGRKM